jgi:transcriptional regulator with XRE-family HTH domain
MKSRLKLLIDSVENGNKSKFARKIDVSSATVHFWLKEDRETLPDTSTIIKICEIYNISANWLLMGSGRREKTHHYALLRNDFSFEIWMEIYNKNVQLIIDNKDTLFTTYKKTAKERMDQLIEECKYDKHEKYLSDVIKNIISCYNQWESKCDYWLKMRMDLYIGKLLPEDREKLKKLNEEMKNLEFELERKLMNLNLSPQ